MEGPTDAQVLAASVDDPARFATIFDRHAATLHRYLARRLGPLDVDAAVGDLFRIAFERRATFDTARADARPWLYGIATNLVARQRRAAARRHAALDRLAAASASAAAIDDEVAARLDAAATVAGVVRRLADLPPGERDALLLHAWEGLPYERVAEALGIPVGTVRSRINRARRRLRELPPRPGEQPVHPDVLRKDKEDLMAAIAGSSPDPYEHRSRMYPRLAYRDEWAALDYLTRVFGFVERREARLEGGSPDESMLAWLEFGAGLVMISRTNSDVHLIASPLDLGGTTTMINVEVDDVDAHYARVVAAGADVTMTLRDAPYGARVYEATDLEGHRWHFQEMLDHVRARGGTVTDAPAPC